MLSKANYFTKKVNYISELTKEGNHLNIIVITLLFLLNIRSKAFRQLNIHAPSIAYVMTFNMLYYYLCKHFLLWDFKAKFMSVRTVRALHIFVCIPLLILLYLANFPKKNRVLYIIKWVIVSTVCELFAYKRGVILFKRGWHIGWSAMLYLKMYVYSYLFNRYKLPVLSLSFITTGAALKIFKVPARNDVLKGPLGRLFRIG